MAATKTRRKKPPARRRENGDFDEVVSDAEILSFVMRNTRQAVVGVSALEAMRQFATSRATMFRRFRALEEEGQITNQGDGKHVLTPSGLRAAQGNK